MAAKGVGIVNLRLFDRFYGYRARQQFLKLYCTKNSDKDKVVETPEKDIKPLNEEERNDYPGSPEQVLSTKSNVKLSGFAKSYLEQQKIIDQIESPKSESKDEKPESFASLLRNSTFINLGDPEGKQVYGTVYHIVDDDLYIDFGWKFHTVCKKPKSKADNIKRGTRVRLLIKSLELSSKFLGSKDPITLNEADCVLLGIERSGKGKSVS